MRTDLDAAHELLEERADLETSQRSAEAEVCAEAERQVVVGVAREVESLRFGEVRRIAVGRAVHQHHLLTFADGCPADVVVRRRDTAHVVDRSDEPDELLGRHFHVDAGLELRPLVGVLATSWQMMRAMTVRVVSAPPSRISKQSEPTSSTVQGPTVDLGVVSTPS